MPRALLSAMLVLILTSTVLAQNPKANPGGKLSLNGFIGMLKLETENFLNPNTESKFQVRRPHQAIRTLEPVTVAEVLDRMAGSLGSDPIADTYIKYHLMYLAIYNDPNAGKGLDGRKFTAIAESLPESIPFERKPDQRWEPPEIAGRYWSLMEKCRATVGFPPFQKRVGPPESFEYMTPAQRTIAESAWSEAKSLQGKFKNIADPDAHRYNARMDWTLWMLRQVRGETAYGMLTTGDPKMLQAVTRKFAADAPSKSAAANDLIAFINAAYFDGWLGQYDAAALKSASQVLREPFATQHRDKPQAKDKDKDKETPTDAGWTDNTGRVANLAEAAYTVVTSLSDGKAPPRPSENEMRRATSEKVTLLPDRKVTGQTLDLATIDAAINAAVAALDRVGIPDEHLNYLSYDAVSRNDWNNGQQGLIAWAMLAAGEPHSMGWMQKRINRLASFDTASTYERTMRLQVLSRLPYNKWERWIRRDADWLVSSMTDQGNFGPRWLGEPSTGYGDNANGQYAAMGLWAAERAGYKIDERMYKNWKRIDQYWRDAQFPVAKGEEGAGWATRSYKSLTNKDNPNDFGNRVAAPMTAGGVLALSQSERYLLGPGRLGVGNKITPELAKGVRWLDDHFSLTDIDGDSDLYYYMWTIQNVGRATGYRTFNKIDWFRESTAKLINDQGTNGLWTGPKGSTVSTAFALLYLTNARGPLAICKVRFADEGGKAAPAGKQSSRDKATSQIESWNNRPNDMVNFTDHLTRQLEVPTNWQICDLDQPVYELIESPLLYLATDRPFTLSDAEVDRLRDYMNAGGMVVTAPEGSNTAGVVKSLQALGGRLFPTREYRRLESTHPFYTLFNKKTPANVQVMTMDNGVRPQFVIINKDVSRDLQADTDKVRDTFNLLTNIYLYATGQDAKRPRIATNYVVARTGNAAKRPVGAARIKYAGEFDPEPASLSQLGAMLANKHQIDLKVTTIEPHELKPQQSIAFLTSTGTGVLKDEEAKSLRDWVQQGGTLWIDCAGGNANAIQFGEKTIAALGFAATDLKPLGDSPIITGKLLPGGYDNTNPGTRLFNAAKRPTISAITIDGRPAIYFTESDLAAGLAGANHWGITGYAVPTARQLVLNGVLDAQRTLARPASSPTTR